MTLNNKEFIKQKSNIKLDVNHSSDTNLNIFPSVTISRNENKGPDMLNQDPAKDLENTAIIADSIFYGIYEKDCQKITVLKYRIFRVLRVKIS